MDSHDLEPELEPPTPRPVPWIDAPAKHVLALLALLAVATLAPRLSIVHPPARNLFLIIAAASALLSVLCLLALAFLVHQKLWSREARYLRHGLVAPATVLDVQFASIHEPRNLSRLRIAIELVRPDTGELVTKTLAFGGLDADFAYLALVGDHVADRATAIWLPGRFRETLTLYPIVRLHGDVGPPR